MNINKIIPDPLKDQFFLVDENIIQNIVSAADVTKKDTVLEIGAGIGNLTKEIAKYAGHIITFEIDKRFKPYLNKLPKNVEVIYEKAKIPKNFHGKIISNPPFSGIEPLLQKMLTLNLDRVILVVPKRTLKTIKTHKEFNSFYQVDILFEVPKVSFYPIPDTNSVVINLKKLNPQGHLALYS